MTREECPIMDTPCNDLRETTKELMAVRLELKGIATEMRALTEIMQELESQDQRIDMLDKLAASTAESVKSANKRIDAMETSMPRLITTTISLCGVIVAVLTLALRMVGN